MKANPELREKMWELCYDLLPEGERPALIAQIKSDPHAARLYAEVRLQADLVGYAATVDDPSLILRADEEKLKTSEMAPAAGRRKEAAQPAAESAGKATKRSLWAANAVAIAAGLALVLLIGVGFFRPQSMDDQIAKLVVFQIEIPGQLTPGLTSPVAIRTASPARQPIAVPLDVKVVDQSGNVKYHETVETTPEGWRQIDIPGDAIRLGARIQVEARGERFAEQQVAQQDEDAKSTAANFVQADLPVARQEPLTYYWVEKPTAAAGETVRMVGVALDRFQFEVQPPPIEEVVVKQQETTQRVQPQWNVNNGLAEGTFLALADGLERAPQPTETPKLEKKLSLIEVERAKDVSLYYRQQAESLEMAGGEGARRALRGSDARSGGMEPAKTLPLAPAKPGPVAADDEGRKEFDKAKEAVAEKALAQGSPAAPQSAAPRIASKPDAVDNVDTLAKNQRQVLDVGKPVQVVLPTDQEGKQLVAVVEFRGLEVVRQKVEPRRERYLKDGKAQPASTTVTLNIPPEIDGNFSLKLVDPVDRSKAVLEQQLYRVPTRELKIEPLNHKDRYDPGELVRLQLRVVNELGEPAAATAAVRVWNSDFVPDDRRELKMLADVVREYQSAEVPVGSIAELAQFGRPQSRLEEVLLQDGTLRGNLQGAPGVPAPGASKPAAADKSGVDRLAQSNDRPALSELKAEGQPAAGAAPVPAAEPADPSGGQQLARSDSLTPNAVEPSNEGMLGGLAESGGSSFGFAAPSATYFDFAQPVTIASNELAIDRQIQLLKNESDRMATAWQATIGRVLVGGGLVALAILGLLFVMRQQVRWSSGTLALVASAASLVIGAAWITGDRQEMTVAMGRGRNDSPAKAAPMARGAAAASVEATTDSMPAMAPATDTYAVPEAQPPSARALATTPAQPTAGNTAPPPKEADARLQSLSGDTNPLAAAVPANTFADEGKDPAGNSKKVAPAQQGASAAPGGKGLEKSGEEKLLSTRRAAVSEPSAAGGGSGLGGRMERGGLGAAPGSPPGMRRDGALAGAAAPSASTTASPPQKPAPRGVDDATRTIDQTTDREKRPLSGDAAAPSAIYFNPQLTTDASGIVTLEFQLPLVASEYRVLLDAYGNGRVGSSADVRIVCRPEE